MDGTADGRSHHQRMLAGDLYLADDPEIRAAHLRARRLQARFNATQPGDDAGRLSLLRQLLGGVGADVVVRPPFYCDYGTQISIGDRVFANYGLVALDVAPIRIADDVQLGPNVQLLTPTHPLDPELRQEKWEAGAPIVLEANAWLGGGAIVLAGVTVGEHSVVGAGAVVTRDVPPHVVVAGNPARIIRHLARGVPARPASGSRAGRPIQ